MKYLLDDFQTRQTYVKWLVNLSRRELLKLQVNLDTIQDQFCIDLDGFQEYFS